MDQLNVDDCPLSIVDGSAVKLMITGLSTLLGVDLPLPSPGTGGGGACVAATFFPQPATSTKNASVRRMAPILEAFNLLFSRMLNKLLFTKYFVARALVRAVSRLVSTLV